MKIILPPLFFFLLLSLAGCSAIVNEINDTFYLAIDGPESVTIEGATYRRGFYGERGYLYPQFGAGSIGKKTLQKEIIYDDGKYKYQRVDYEGHDWVHSNGGGNTGGAVYCAEDQWEQMHDYYADPYNFDYYYHLGNNVNETPLVVNIPEIDPQKFDELFAFAKENSYDLGTNNKAMQKTRRLPEAVRNGGRKALYFYKVSNDGYFATVRHEYFVHDGKLLKVFFHDGGSKNEGIREVLVIDVPDELGQYFIDLMERYPE